MKVKIEILKDEPIENAVTGDPMYVSRWYVATFRHWLMKRKAYVREGSAWHRIDPHVIDSVTGKEVDDYQITDAIYGAIRLFKMRESGLLSGECK